MAIGLLRRLLFIAISLAHLMLHEQEGVTMTKHNHVYYRLLSAILAIALFWPEISYAKPAAGNGALELWNQQGIANSPQWVQYWLIIMISSFALGLLFIWNRIEARCVVGGLIIGLLFSKFILENVMGLLPLSGLVALVHLIFWSPALYLLLKNRPFTKEKSLFALWSGWITLVILFSFIFDIRDTVIYLDYMLGLNLL